MRKPRPEIAVLKAWKRWTVSLCQKVGKNEIGYSYPIGFHLTLKQAREQGAIVAKNVGLPFRCVWDGKRKKR